MVLAALASTVVFAGCARAPVEPAGRKLCEEFASLRKAGDPRALDLLAAAPPPPKGSISEEEAERLDADFVLRGDFQIDEVQAAVSKDGQSPRFILVGKGIISTQTYQVRTPQGEKPHQRSLFNPEVVVEVADGKIHGIVARLHVN
jgi:hypothetical protein